MANAGVCYAGHVKTAWLLLLGFGAGAAFSQTQSLSQGPHRLEITLELHVGAKGRVVDPGHVFSAGDEIRFRYRANFSGYLYVTNQGTSGKSSVLFPSAETGSANRVEAGKEYLVPAADSGWFRVTGPAGFDVLYWLISPVELPSSSRPAPSPAAPPELIPRCSDSIFRSRGECVDRSAGPRPAAQAASPRSLQISRDRNVSVVSASAPLAGPVVFEFRLAHR